MRFQDFFPRLFVTGLFLSILFVQEGFSQPSSFQDTTHSSLSGWSKFQYKINKSTSTKAYQMTYISVPLIAAGLIVKNESKHFNDLRNDYIPTFRHHYDDYLQYAPAFAMLGLKAAGVKGRSSWGRMLTSDAFSAGVMAVTVNLLKTAIKVERPDGSGNNSFPSGHTATAFMTATMLHKEYGLTRSPWYSIGAYTVATATAISRQLNNKHWMSDVLAGAGIGILSTELGYYFADLIFKDKGIITNNLYEQPYNINYRPSFIGLYTGFNLAPTRLHLTADLKLKTTTGSCTGFEGAWFLNRFMGFGGRLTISNNPLTFDNNTYEAFHPEVKDKIVQVETGSINIYSGMAGLYLAFPLTSRWQAGSKALAGFSHWSNNTLSALIEKGPDKLETQEIVKILKSYNPTIGTGLSLMYFVRPGLGTRLFCDYTYSPTRQVYYAENNLPKDNHQAMHVFTLGASVNILFLHK